MGLLDKAVSKSIPELDPAGKTVRDRILQLTQKNISLYMVLSLLKGYGSFEKGVCLFLKGDRYISYASIGLGIEQIHLPPEQLYPPVVQGKKYYQIELAELFSLQSADSNEILWAFPLDSREPCGAILLLGGESRFNPRIMVRLLEDIRGVLIPRQEAL
ncbi:MAG: hypothetical protein LBD29_10575 [Treponema sp.]|jgi:hypothetical protein|nr:hypothetical protein [Treponema sp.]